MKDLSEYLCNLTASSGIPNSESPGGKNTSKICENEENKQNIDDTKTVHKKKKRKKKLKRKPSDPAVKNIVDLLSTSLCIISPNASFNGQLESQKPNDIQKENKLSQGIDENTKNAVLISKCESNSCINVIDQSNVSNTGIDEVQSKSKNKLNAFQFMMESRNKSIGQNSPGKERSLESDKASDENKHKEVLSARKSLLQNWADKKGAVKRKREEEEKDAMINYKLQKRARRMKALLKASTPKENQSNITSSKKIVRRISSSCSESSKDSVVLVSDSNKLVNDSLLEVIEENAQDKVFNESKVKETKQGTLTFFGIVNKAKKHESVEKPKGSKKEKEIIKIKLNTPKLKKNKLEANINAEEVISNSSKCDSEKSKTKKLKSKKQKCANENEASHESTSKKVTVHKTPKYEDRNDDDSFTPRSLKSWKMKIKICEKDTEQGDEEKTEQRKSRRTRKTLNQKLLFSDESSNEDKTVVFRKKGKTASKINEIIVCSDEDLEKEKKEQSKPVKIAPIFTKATPKPKLNPEIIEARKQFLMSGIPDSLKRTIEKQQSVEEREYDIFPSISHVQQKCETETFWDLSNVSLNLKEYLPLEIQKQIMCSRLTNSHITDTLNIRKEVEKVDKLKTLLNKIKSDNPNYPVYKTFRLIYEKSGKTLRKKQETVQKRNKNKRRSKSSDKSVEIIEDIKTETDSAEHAMWTEKYKPKYSDDIIGNTEGIKDLKKWLEVWKNCSEEINARKKKKWEDYHSDSEFDTTDCDSRDSTKFRDNTIVVGGPCGSGKSTAIYAICNELSFNVIELNASSKRTGKRLLQELQEATQSHQVRNKEKMQKYFQSKEKQTSQTDKKMCVLLIEDVDIVFEQDDGFISALTQLVSSSKRPIILTTTDTSSVFVQKFISQYKYIPFLPLSAQSLTTWLQIVCLIEGLLVNAGDIGSLLEFNKGDVRKTLLQLQFWVQSGGQITRDDIPVRTKTEIITTELKLADDEEEPCLDNESKETKHVFTHSNCIKSFEIFKLHEPFRVPYYINLGLVWWNLPNILGIRNFSEDRIKKFKENHFEFCTGEEKTTALETEKLCPIEKRKLNLLSKLYDSLAFTDVSFRTVNYFNNLEPDVKNYSCTIKDSLELCENTETYNGYKDFVHEVTHSLVNGYVEEFSRIEKCESVLNIAVPEKAERRWRAKMHVCEDVLLEAVPTSSHIERRSIALDYMPCLRLMSRLESRRAANNTKRGNRFRNYLRSLGINYNDNTLKLACNILMDEL